MLRPLNLRSILLIIACALSLQTHAQETIILDEIIVTANKLDEDIDKVSQSITVIDKVMLEERRITNIDKLIQQIPNMTTVIGSTGSEVNVRGINASAFTRNNPAVLYVDGIPTSSRYAYNIPLVDVERVEVLRGPQGTLYGKDSIGGVINIVTKQPGEHWQGQIGAEAGSFNKQRLTFNANGAVSPGLFSVGVWGELTKDEGWIENTNASLDDKANDEESNRLGINLLLTPTDNFSARLQLMHEKDNKGFIDGSTTDTAEAFNQAERSDFEKINYDEDTFFETKTDSQGLYLEYLSGFGNIESITTHRKNDVDVRTDIDYSSGKSTFFPGVGVVSLNGGFNFEDLSIETITQELRWSHELASGLRWVTGLYFEQEETNYDRFGSQFAGSDFTNISENSSDTQAIFGQITLPLASSIELALGGRYQEIKKDIDLDYYLTPVVGGNVTLGAPTVELKTEKTWSKFLPKIALSYYFNDDWTAYTNISTGYMPGGFNIAANNTNEANNSFEPQQSLNYEIGTKGRLLDDRMFLSAVMFYMDIEDIHAFSFSLTDMSFRTFNVEKARSYGLEIEMDFIVNESWQLNAALATVNAEYRSDHSDLFGTTIEAGNNIERTPSYSVNIGGQYNHSSGVYGRVDLVNYGKMYFDSANTLKEDGYTVVNLKTGYQADAWEVYAYVNNLTDSDYKTYGALYPYGGPIVNFGDPREFGIGAKYRF